MRLLPVVANGQLGAAMYMRAGDAHVPFQLHVLDVTDGRVSRVVAFLDSALFAKFGLPSTV
jgi:RNA polymerase sigma-70 factor (ECF subfamily)